MSSVNDLAEIPSAEIVAGMVESTQGDLAHFISDFVGEIVAGKMRKNDRAICSIIENQSIDQDVINWCRSISNEQSVNRLVNVEASGINVYVLAMFIGCKVSLNWLYKLHKLASTRRYNELSPLYQWHIEYYDRHDEIVELKLKGLIS